MKKLSFIVALLCASMMAWAASNLCGVEPAHPSATTRVVLLSWNTAENGDVVVTIAPGEGTTIATFRNAGFTGDVDQFKVLSGEGFATEENASKYFYEKDNVNGQTTYTLYRTGAYNLPSPCKIKYVPGALEWIADTDDNAYDNNGESVIVYNYGTLCGATLAAPVIAVASDGTVTFAAVDGATSYKAYVYEGSEVIKECPVTSGDKVWNPYLAGDYAIYVRAFNSSTSAYSDFSNGVVWSATGDPEGDMQKSEICGYKLGDGNTEAYLSFYTDRSTGNFMISVEAGANGDDSKTFFRDAGGLELSGFKYNGETFTDYFTRIPADNSDIEGKVNTLTFVPRTDEGHIPAYLGSITFSGGWVTWRTFNNGEVQNNASNGFSFTYVYGTNCNEIDDHVPAVINEVSVVSTTTTSATLLIDITEKDDFNEDRELRSITVRDEANGYAERKITLDGSSQVTLSGLNKNTIYNYTVKALDSGGNITEETIKVTLTFDPSANLALNKNCDAGAVQNDNTPNKAVNGNSSDFWTCYGQGDASSTWWTVNLGMLYEIDEIIITFNDINAAYNIYASEDSISWDNVVINGTSTSGSSETHDNLNTTAQYFKVTSSDNRFGIKEFEVYGTGYYIPVDPGDPTSIDNTNADAKAVKVIENGQLIIIKNGVRYNVVGSVVK